MSQIKAKTSGKSRRTERPTAIEKEVANTQPEELLKAVASKSVRSEPTLEAVHRALEEARTEVRAALDVPLSTHQLDLVADAVAKFQTRIEAGLTKRQRKKAFEKFHNALAPELQFHFRCAALQFALSPDHNFTLVR